MNISFLWNYKCQSKEINFALLYLNITANSGYNSSTVNMVYNGSWGHISFEKNSRNRFFFSPLDYASLLTITLNSIQYVAGRAEPELTNVLNLIIKYL